MNRAYYDAPIEVFRTENPLTILGALAEHHDFDLEDRQRLAWQQEISLLQEVLAGFNGHICFEFSIPRMGKRADVVLLMDGIVFVLEFKVGETNYPAQAIEQVMDYALDLKNFHEPSHNRPIVPFLISTDARPIPNQMMPDADQVYKPICANTLTVTDLLHACMGSIQAEPIDPSVWLAGQYKPTPTIIEAAQALYRGHNVREISRSDSGAINLSKTSDAIDDIIEYAQKHHQKAICFITGVPGAGKTLAGLNIANRRLHAGEGEHAVFLSGNGPLVIVLREALTRDDIAKGQKRKDAHRKADMFIQNIHHFRDEYLGNTNAPLEQVVIFDEAQRAWGEGMLANFMKRKRGQPNFTMSEPELLIEVMDRHMDWAVIICLVGGGQEINTGEAGLRQWFQVLQADFPNWHVYISKQITDSEYLGQESPINLLPQQQLTVNDDLHLAVSVRSFRSEKVSALIKSILDGDLKTSQELCRLVTPHYPIVLTRDLESARNWVRQQARGSERTGLLASSGARRLRPEGIFVDAEIEVAHWFLNGREDVRSSYALEGVATEFDIQGLELDWTVVGWDGDLRYLKGRWEYRAFKGTKWQAVNDLNRQLYLKNSYRVLLTRARQGMVIFVPKGDKTDITRLPEFYDGTFEYLRQVGLTVI